MLSKSDISSLSSNQTPGIWLREILKGTRFERRRPKIGCCGLWLCEEAVLSLKIQNLRLIGVNLVGLGVLKFVSQEVVGRVTTPEIWKSYRYTILIHQINIQ